MALPTTARVGPSDSPSVVTFAHAKPRDFRSIRSWQRAAREISNPRARDAADFARAAFVKWNQCRRERRVASTLREAQDMMRNNPHEEVQMLVLAKSNIVGAAMAGFCLFRRIWCNNIAVDLLAGHPREIIDEHSRRQATSPDDGPLHERVGRS